MKWNAIKTNWPGFIEPLLERFPTATEEDLLALEGNRERLVDYIAGKQGYDRAEAEAQIAEFEQGSVPADVAMDETRDNENIRASAAHIPVGEDVYSDDKDFGDDQEPARPIGRSD